MKSSVAIEDEAAESAKRVAGQQIGSATRFDKLRRTRCYDCPNYPSLTCSPCSLCGSPEFRFCLHCDWNFRQVQNAKPNYQQREDSRNTFSRSVAIAEMIFCD